MVNAEGVSFIIGTEKVVDEFILVARSAAYCYFRGIEPYVWGGRFEHLSA